MWLASIAFSFLTQVGAAQQGVSPHVDSAAALIEVATHTASIPKIDSAVAMLEHTLAQSPNDAIALHYLGYALYRKATLHDKRDKAGIKRLLEAADRTLERSSQSLKWPETFALRAAALGQLIGSGGPFAAMRLGGRANAMMDEALRLGPTNPRVWMLHGAGSLFKPRLFGGGLDKAEQQLRKSIDLFAADHPHATPSWGRAEAHAWLGVVLMRRKRTEEARASLNRALEITPGFQWVIAELLPELERSR